MSLELDLQFYFFKGCNRAKVDSPLDLDNPQTINEKN